ncbi:HAD family hydrolase [Anaerocolumna sp. MB42-C2]|uniref:HAD family hydrolase n=1 Tax=Anaerocolumna sp. MB42-C2 TaxID=3070997 RepID=UPI0027DF51C8|nr:HAD family hydrolase [Anaerocolumna sp. MB42-C2]WMJ89321.1 HAD family hydrolase [Anaerocolumna sp. MB42-C2]
MNKVIFFDLFFTLITPSYLESKNENDVLGLTIKEWEQYAENDVLYNRRATGQVLSPEKIIDDIVSMIPAKVNELQKREILLLRQKRMQAALINIDHQILSTIQKLKENGIKTCIISNADVIDTMYWDKSPLYALFDDAVFSHKVKYLKPDSYIYNVAMKKMNVNSSECIFVGDGGSNELFGAKRTGMRTVFTEYLEKKPEEKRIDLLEFADFHITEFSELLKI